MKGKAGLISHVIVLNLVLAEWLVNRSQKLRRDILSWTGEAEEDQLEAATAQTR